MNLNFYKVKLTAATESEKVGNICSEFHAGLKTGKYRSVYDLQRCYINNPEVLEKISKSSSALKDIESLLKGAENIDACW